MRVAASLESPCMHVYVHTKGMSACVCTCAFRGTQQACCKCLMRYILSLNTSTSYVGQAGRPKKREVLWRSCRKHSPPHGPSSHGVVIADFDHPWMVCLLQPCERVLRDLWEVKEVNKQW